LLAAVLPLQLAFGLVFAWGGAAPYVLAQARWSPLLVGAVFSATPLGYGTGMLAGGRLADRLPPRPICWSAVGLLAIGIAVAFAFPTPATFILFYSGLGLGIGGGLAMAGSVAAAAYAFPSRVGTIGGAITACYAAAGLVQLPAVTLLSASAGWLTAIRLVGGASLALAAICVLVLPSVPAPVQRHDSDRATLLQVLGQPRVWTGFVIQGLATSLGAFALVNIVLYARAHGMGLGSATLALTLAAAANVAGRAGAGAAADRLGVEPVLFAILAVNVLAAAVFASGAAQATVVLLAAAAAGAGFGGAAGVMPRAAARSSPDAPNTAFGIHFAGYALGAFAGPLVGAAAGGGGAAWIAVGAPSLLGLAVLWMRSLVMTPARGPARG
jgi:predicted MFS family arabinose efflux permease